jgi:hypothetical protein
MTKLTAWEHVGEIGVDAGLCWIGDPCYIVSKDATHVFETWEDFIKQLDFSRDAQQFNYKLGHAGLGVVVQTGYGDGSYPVEIRREASSGRVAEVRVKFI